MFTIRSLARSAFGVAGRSRYAWQSDVLAHPDITLSSDWER